MRAHTRLLHALRLSIAAMCITGLPAPSHSSPPAGVAALESGQIGALKIGMSSEGVSRLLSRPLSVPFAGEARAGATSQDRQDLCRLALDSLDGARVTALDLFFKERGTRLLLEFVSVGVPCSAVPSLQRELGAREAALAAEA